MIKLTIIFFLIYINLYSQLFFVRGIVKDKTTGEVLSFANIRLMNTGTGTAANSNGEFELRLKEGKYTLIISYIGYKSDSISFNLTSNKFVSVFLEPVSIKLSEIVVSPGKNPALEIIQSAINYRKEREEKLNSYQFYAYTKLLIKTTKDIIASDRSVGLSIGGKDTGNLKITGIIENHSKGYFKKPNKYKDEILARKQSANAPPTVNILTGGRFTQNFYTNDIRFFNKSITSPIADNAFDFYYYLIKDTLALDNHIVFNIYFEPIDNTEPGLFGNIYILDGLYAIIKIDAQLNDAVLPNIIFNKVDVMQQFADFEDGIFMPVDYRLFVEGNFLGLAKFGFELNSVFYDYSINTKIDDNIFNMALVKVMSDADKKDSTYWKINQTIPNTNEELEAYKRIDSLEHISRSFWSKNSILSTKWYFSDNYSITAPLSLYSFNKVTGHQLNFGFFVEDELDKRFNSNFVIEYGFSDKKFKTNLSLNYLFNEYRTGEVSLNIFNKLEDLFGENISYDKFTSTFLSLFTKYDFRDYYYVNGWSLSISNEILPIVSLKAGYINKTFANAYNNTDFSFFYRSRKYSDNKKIYETKISAISFGLALDIRKYIENGYFRQRINRGEIFSRLYSEVLISNQSILKSSLNFKLFNVSLEGDVLLFNSASFSYRIHNVFSENGVPFQMMYSLSGNISTLGKELTFRTIRLNEIFGDRGTLVNTQLNFNNEIFRLSGISFLKNLKLKITCHFNAALISITQASKRILIHNYKEFKYPFYEIGFGVGPMFLPLLLEFTWKLNYRNGDNFTFGINTFLL